MEPKNYNPSSEGFSELSKHAFKTYIDARDQNNKQAQLIFSWVFGFILCIAATEGIKVIFRKNFGYYGLNLLKIVICAGAFICVGILSFIAINTDDDFLRESGTSDSHLATGILFTITGIIILINGFKEKRKAREINNFSDFEGDSKLLGFLKKEIPLRIIQGFFEPVTVLAIGIAFCLFDKIAGIAVIFCAASVWFEMAYSALFNTIFKSHVETVDNLNNSINPRQGFNEVKID